LIEYLKVARIDHWLKNIFIVFGHAVAFVLVLDLELSQDFIKNALLSLVPACLLASSYYIMNEILDAPYDALHPTKKHRGIPAGLVSVPILWVIMLLLLALSLYLAWVLFPNKRYFYSLLILFGCAIAYNVKPLRLKDVAFLDVITESINNPLRLFLGWFAVLPHEKALPPLSIILSWWFFGALLMTGKRYSEYKLLSELDDQGDISGLYRKSFKNYNQRRLVMAMITYSCLFCFCTGIAMAVYPALNNLVLVFPMIVVAIIAYFRHAMKEDSAKLEPEQLLKSPALIVAIALTGLAAIFLLYAQKSGLFNAQEALQLMQPRWTRQN